MKVEKLIQISVLISVQMRPIQNTYATIHIYTQNHNDTIKTSDAVFRKIWTSHFIWKGRVWEGVGDRIELKILTPPLVWPSELCLSRSPGLLNRRPRGTALCRVLAFSTTSFIQLCLVSKTNWLPVFTELYNSSIAHSISPHDWPSECVTSAVFGMACLAGSEVNIQHLLKRSSNTLSNYSQSLVYSYLPTPPFG